MADIATLHEQIKQAEKEKLENCGFKKGDCVESVEGGKSFKGHIESLYVSSIGDDKGKIIMHIRGAATFYINWSSNLLIKKEPFEDVRHITNTVSIDYLDGLDSMIRQKEKEIEKATTLLKHQKKRLEKLVRKHQDTCIHKFGKGYETGNTIKHLIGESEEKEYTCEYCGKVVITC